MNKLKEKWFSIIVLAAILVAIIFNSSEFEKWLLYILPNGKGSIINFNLNKLFCLHILLTLKITILSVAIFFALLIINSSKFIKKMCTFLKVFKCLYKAIYYIFIIGIFVFSLTGSRNRIIIALTIGSVFYLMKNILNSMKNIEYSIIETSKAIGMTESNILFKIKIPMCYKNILKETGKVLIGNLNILVLFSFVGMNGLGTIVVQAVQNKNLVSIALVGTILFLTSFIILLLCNDEVN